MIRCHRAFFIKDLFSLIISHYSPNTPVGVNILKILRFMFSFALDVDECSENICAQLCVNYPGGYSCYCDGKKGFKLAQDQKSCEVTFRNAQLPISFLK